MVHHRTTVPGARQQGRVNSMGRGRVSVICAAHGLTKSKHLSAEEERICPG